MKILPTRLALRGALLFLGDGLGIDEPLRLAGAPGLFLFYSGQAADF